MNNELFLPELPSGAKKSLKPYKFVIGGFVLLTEIEIHTVA